MKTISPDNFPRRLREIPDAPEKLYLRGQTSGAKRYLAVVGSRKFTSYGKSACQNLMVDLAGSDVCIVSGLALGMDAIAHKAALKAGLDCLAVPGSGLNDDVLYPATNRPLAKRILKAGGGLVSEFEPDFTAKAWGFPKRNRIMAGLSHAVLIIEATEKSGTLITARLATEYNRDVFAVPGSIKSANTAGPHSLIRDGAALIRNGKDILRELDLDINPTPQSSVELSEDERLILKAINKPLSKDDLIQKVEIPVSRINILLSQMELKGAIKEANGKIEKL